MSASRLLQSPCFELWWAPQCGTFRFESPGRALECVAGIATLSHGRERVMITNKLPPGRLARSEFEDAHGLVEEVEIHYPKSQGLVLRLRIRLYPARPFALVQVSVTNIGVEPVTLKRFFIRTTPGGFHTLASPTGSFVNGWQSWSRAGFIPEHKPVHVIPWLLRWLQSPMVHNAHTPRVGKPGRFWSESVGAVVTSREALVAGGVSLAEQFVQVWMDLREGHQEVLIQSQADGVSLSPGEARSSAWFYLEWVALPNSDPLAQYAHAVSRQMHVPTPRCAAPGWCSWYIYWNKVGEVDLIDNLANAALLADELPIQIIQLDEGFQKSWGDWLTCNERFPHGLPWLADRIHGSGFKSGLWLAPLTAHPKSYIVKQHSDWILRNAQGRPVFPGWVSGSLTRVLDPTHPGVLEHIRQLIDTVVHQWGYDYIKLDFMYAAALSSQRYQVHLTRAQALRQVFQTIREVAGEDTYLVACGSPLGPAIGLVDAMRIGSDTAPRWKSAIPVISRFAKNDPNHPSLRNSLRNVMTRSWIHNRWWCNDPDVLMVRADQTQLTEDEVLAQATLLGLSGGLLMLSDDLETLSEERRAIASMLLPPLLDGMDVLDLFDKSMPEVAVVPVARSWAQWRLLGLFNWSDTPVERALPNSFHFDAHKTYHIVDFWERRYFRFTPSAPRPIVHLPAHGVVLLGVREVKAGPHLVATTFHISQGAEVTDWRVDGQSLTITIVLDRLAQGEVWLALPSRPLLASFNDHTLADDAIRAVAPGIWALTCYVNRRGDLRVSWSDN